MEHWRTCRRRRGWWRRTLLCCRGSGPQPSYWHESNTRKPRTRIPLGKRTHGVVFTHSDYLSGWAKGRPTNEVPLARCIHAVYADFFKFQLCAELWNRLKKEHRHIWQDNNNLLVSSQTWTQQLPVDVKGRPSNGPTVRKKDASERTSGPGRTLRVRSRPTCPEAKRSLSSWSPAVGPHLCSEPQRDWTQRGEDGREVRAGDAAGWAASVYLRIHWLHLMGWALCMWV